MLSALVLDGDSRGSLAITRSLGRHGVRVSVVSTGKSSLAGSSRYCAEKISYPDPQTEPGAFIGWLKSYLSKSEPAVIYTSSDITTSLVGSHRASLPTNARYAFPPQESLRIALDKSATLRLAEKLGHPVPRTYRVSRSKPLILSQMDCCYPVAIKCADSDASFRPPVAYALDREQMLEIIAQMLEVCNCVLIQEVICGEGTGIFALFGNGEPVAISAHRRLCEKPPWGGVSVLSESITPPQDTLRIAISLLYALNWHGPAMVEFKRGDDGTPYLMEINPRFWGSLELAIRSGVDFPWIYYQMASGEPHGSIPVLRRAINRWVLGETDSLITSIRNNNIFGLHASRIGAVLFHLLSLKYGPNCEIERASDLKPALYEYRRWFADSINSLLLPRARGGGR